jgi:hypothetical protein
VTPIAAKGMKARARLFPQDVRGRSNGTEAERVEKRAVGAARLVSLLEAVPQRTG